MNTSKRLLFCSLVTVYFTFFSLYVNKFLFRFIQNIFRFDRKKCTIKPTNIFLYGLVIGIRKKHEVCAFNIIFYQRVETKISK